MIAALAIALGLAGALPPATQAVTAPTSLYLFHPDGFTYQDPNMYACTATSAQDMLNFLAIRKLGGSGFVWKVDNRGTTRDAILAWERQNDTLQGGNGSDPHGWRNALNYYGWGAAALTHGRKVYEDYSFSTYDAAVKAIVRQMAYYRKPVGALAWAGKHAHMVVGYYGLKGNPFEKDANGAWTNRFTIAGFYLADPLRSQNLVNKAVSYGTWKSSSNLKLRFQPYRETDSPYDDPYTPGTRAAKSEWFGRWVIIAPVR
jgi:hypothetical protein